VTGQQRRSVFNPRLTVPVGDHLLLLGHGHESGLGHH
jgi:hypothetical protein